MRLILAPAAALLAAFAVPTASTVDGVAEARCTRFRLDDRGMLPTPPRTETRRYSGVVALLPANADPYDGTQPMFQSTGSVAERGGFDVAAGFRINEAGLLDGDTIRRMTEAARAYASTPGTDDWPQYFAASFDGFEAPITPEYEAAVGDCMGSEFLESMRRIWAQPDNRPYVTLERLVRFDRCPENRVERCGEQPTPAHPELIRFGPEREFDGLVTIGGEPYLHSAAHNGPPEVWDDDRVALTAVELGTLAPLYGAYRAKRPERGFFPQIFRVRFRGRLSLAPGVFGAVYRPTERRHGVVVTRMATVQACPFGPERAQCEMRFPAKPSKVELRRR